MVHVSLSKSIILLTIDLVGEIKGLGGYSEYSLVDEHICFKVPKGIPLEQAATVPLAAATAWLAFFSETSLNIGRDQGSKVSILIWGGSCKCDPFHIKVDFSDAFQ